jgi:hypothetical protein
VTTIATLQTDDLDTLLADEIVGHAADMLGRSHHAFDAGGDLAGLVYYATETRTWYGADLDDCRRLLADQIEAQSVTDEDRREALATVYSHWCSATSLPEGESEDAAATAAGWTL